MVMLLLGSAAQVVYQCLHLCPQSEDGQLMFAMHCQQLIDLNACVFSLSGKDRFLVFCHLETFLHVSLYTGVLFCLLLLPI